MAKKTIRPNLRDVQLRTVDGGWKAVEVYEDGKRIFWFDSAHGSRILKEGKREVVRGKLILEIGHLPAYLHLPLQEALDELDQIQEEFVSLQVGCTCDAIVSKVVGNFYLLTMPDGIDGLLHVSLCKGRKLDIGDKVTVKIYKASDTQYKVELA